MQAAFASVLFALLVAEAHCSSAIATMQGMFNYSGVVGGKVAFLQVSNGVQITVAISGMPPGQHGLHIHSVGDISDNCAAAGAHYNPFNTTHGGLTSAVRHLGDIGNAVADSNGNVAMTVVLPNVSLDGTYSLLNRTITIHEDVDDLGTGNFSDSHTTGHSGRRIGCGIILGATSTNSACDSVMRSSIGGTFALILASLLQRLFVATD